MYTLTPLAGLPGGWEWMVVLVIFLLLFGRRLPGVARSLGQGISSFKKGLNDPVDENNQSENDGGESEPAPKAEKSETTASAE